MLFQTIEGVFWEVMMRTMVRLLVVLALVLPLMVTLGCRVTGASEPPAELSAGPSGEAGLHYDHGRELLGKGHYEEAIQEFDKALDSDADCAACYYYRGLAYYLNGQKDLAELGYNKAVALESDWVGYPYDAPGHITNTPS